MCQLQDLQRDEIWSLKVRLVSNRMPRLRAEETGLMTVFESIVRVGLSSFDSCAVLPKMRNSVFDGLRLSRLADIQDDT